MAKDQDDFVGLIGRLTDFIQNERVAAYNEGVDMILDSARAYLRSRDIEPKGDNLPDLIDEIVKYELWHHKSLAVES